jgi:hypothetical protein
MTLKDTKPGDRVVSNVWVNFEWAGSLIPRDLVVEEHIAKSECVWCRPADGLTLDRIPLYADLVCRKVL